MNESIEYKEALKNQITESAGNVKYTYVSHWNIVNRLKTEYKAFKVVQIILTALSTGGFLASLISGIPQLCWVGGFTSAIALAINLYMLNFNLPDSIKKHTDAANELWEIREKYTSLLVDFSNAEIEDIIKKRDLLIMSVSKVNREYPGTDEKSFKKAQKNIKNYMYNEGEAAKIINMKMESEKSNS